MRRIIKNDDAMRTQNKNKKGKLNIKCCAGESVHGEVNCSLGCDKSGELI